VAAEALHKKLTVTTAPADVDYPLIMTSVLDEPPVQVTVTPCARFTAVIESMLLQTSGSLKFRVVVKAPTLAAAVVPPVAMNVKDPPVAGMNPAGSAAE